MSTLLTGSQTCALPSRQEGRLKWFDSAVPMSKELTLRRLDGTRVALSSTGNKLVIINFWASWCLPCVAEMPTLYQLRARLRNRGILIVMANLDDDNGAMRRFVAANGFDPAAIYLDEDRSLARALGVRTLPASFIVDPRRGAIAKVIGYMDWSSPDVRREMTRHIQ